MFLFFATTTNGRCDSRIAVKFASKPSTTSRLTVRLLLLLPLLATYIPSSSSPRPPLSLSIWRHRPRPICTLARTASQLGPRRRAPPPRCLRWWKRPRREPPPRLWRRCKCLKVGLCISPVHRLPPTDSPAATLTAIATQRPPSSAHLARHRSISLLRMAISPSFAPSFLVAQFQIAPTNTESPQKSSLAKMAGSNAQTSSHRRPLPSRWASLVHHLPV